MADRAEAYKLALEMLLDGTATSTRTATKSPSGEDNAQAEAEQLETGTMVEARIEAQSRQIAEQHESLTRRAELAYSYRGGARFLYASSAHAEHV